MSIPRVRVSARAGARSARSVSPRRAGATGARAARSRVPRRELGGAPHEPLGADRVERERAVREHAEAERAPEAHAREIPSGERAKMGGSCLLFFTV